MDENVAVWETAEELYAVAKADYQSDKSSPEKGKANELRTYGRIYTYDLVDASVAYLHTGS